LTLLGQESCNEFLLDEKTNRKTANIPGRLYDVLVLGKSVEEGQGSAPVVMMSPIGAWCAPTASEINLPAM
jgi:hypothetical protein